MASRTKRNDTKAAAAEDVAPSLAKLWASLATDLQHPVPGRQREALQRLVRRITVRRDGLQIELRSDGLGLMDTQDDPGSQDASEGARREIAITARFVRKGQDLHLVLPAVDGVDQATRLDKSLVKAIARAVTWYDDLVSGRASSMREIAEREQVSERYVAQLLPLALLKPNLVEGCIAGALELSIAAAEIAKGVTFPAVWEAQQTQLAGTMPV